MENAVFSARHHGKTVGYQMETTFVLTGKRIGLQR